MLNWLKSLFAWRGVRNTGVHSYEQNTVTGARRVVRIAEGWQPVDHYWLCSGEWNEASPPPFGGSSVRRP